jgi:hypothetical protein
MANQPHHLWWGFHFGLIGGGFISVRLARCCRAGICGKDEVIFDRQLPGVSQPL